MGRGANDAIRANFQLMVGDGIFPRRRTRRSHAIRCEKRLPGRLCTKEILQGRWREMNPIGNEKSDQLVSRQKALDDIVVAMHFNRNAISQVGAKPGTRSDRLADIGIRRIRVTERNLCACAGD